MTAHRIIPKMLRGRLRHPPTCVNCNAPITLDPKGNWQHLGPAQDDIHGTPTFTSRNGMP